MKHARRILCVVVLWTLVFSTWSVGQDEAAKQEDARQELFLSIDDAIRYALEYNLDIRVQEFEPQIKQEEINEAETAFDLTLTSEGSETINEPVGQNSPRSVTNLTAGVEKRLSTGGSYQVGVSTGLMIFSEFDTTTTNPQTGQPMTVTLDPDTQYSTSLDFTVNHALLKNRGKDVNTTQIEVARKHYDISLSELRANISETISQVKTTYWDLVYAIGDLEAKRLSLELAYDLVKINEAQVEVGTLAPIEVLQAKATAASREVDIINAEKTVRDTEDQLKRLLNIPEQEEAMWSSALIPTDDPLESSPNVSLQSSIQRALDNREELEQVRTGLEIQELLLHTNENQLLPEVNVLGRLSMSGTDESVGDTLGELAGLDNFSFTAGVNFSYPLGNRAAKSTYNQTKLEIDKSRLSLHNLEQLITVQVRQTVRSVNTAYKLVDATRVALELAQEQLDAEQKKFNEGLSTNFQVLNYQEQLASAKSRHTMSLTSYNKALVGLEQITGEILQRHNIVIQE